MTKEEFADRHITYLFANTVFPPSCPDSLGMKSDKKLCRQQTKCKECWKQALTEAGLIKEGE